MDDNALGQYLGQRRDDLGLSQKAVADAVGISRPYLAQIENGNRKPGDDTLKRLFKALGVPIKQAMEDLLGDQLDPGFLRTFSGPIHAFDLLQEYLTEEQFAEVVTALGSSEQIAAAAQYMLTEEPVAGPDRWLDLSKEDRRLIQRLVNRLLGAEE